MGRVLTIVGASARAAAQSAVRGGYTVHAADLFADADLRSCCKATQVTDYPAGLAEVVNASQSGGWMYTGALENEPELVDRLACRRTLWGNAGAALRRVRQPQEVERVLRNAGLKCPRVSIAMPEKSGEARWLRKSIRSAGGSQVAADIHGAIPAHAPPDEYFQQWIEGLSFSAVYVAAAGRARLLGVTRQLVGEAWTGASGFRYCGSIGPLVLAEREVTTCEQIGQALAEEFQLAGIVGVDAVVNSAGVWPVEVNPRYTASCELLDRACGFSSVGLHVDACERACLPEALDIPPRRCCGKAILFAARPLVADHQIEQFSADRREAWPTFADLPLPGTRIEAGWPILTVLCEGADEPAVLAQLQAEAARVRECLEPLVVR